MIRFRLLIAVALLAFAGVANATPRSFPRSNFDAGFDAGVRAARGGHVRAPQGPSVEIRRGPLGRVRSIRVK